MSQATRASRKNILRTQGYGYFAGKHLDIIRCIKTALVERGFTSREHNRAVDLRNLFEEYAETCELLEVESRIW